MQHSAKYLVKSFFMQSNSNSFTPVLQKMVSHQQLPIIWEQRSAKKTLKLQKWPTTFHIQKKDFKTAKPEISFFFLILLFNSTQTSSRIQIHKERVFATFMYECWTRVDRWIGYGWKQLFFLHETLHDYSLWNIRTDLTDGLPHT